MPHPLLYKIDNPAHDGIGFFITEGNDVGDGVKIRGDVKNGRRQHQRPGAGDAEFFASPQGRPAAGAFEFGAYFQTAAEHVAGPAADHPAGVEMAFLGYVAGGIPLFPDLVGVEGGDDGGDHKRERHEGIHGNAVRQVTVLGELDDGHQDPQHENLDHAPGRRSLHDAQNPRQTGRHPAQPQGQQDVQKPQQLNGRRDKGGQQNQQAHVPPALVEEDLDAGNQGGLFHLAGHAKGNERKDIDQDEQHDPGQGQRQGRLDTVRFALIQEGTTAEAPCRSPQRDRRYLLNQFTIVTGDEGIGFHGSDSLLLAL